MYDDLVTNFDKEDKYKYLLAIHLYGDNSLYVKEDAYDVHGRHVPGLNALHCSERKDLTAFWNLFESL